METKIAYVGVNFKKTPLNIREKLSFSDELKIEFFNRLKEININECVIISTCNRSEIIYTYNIDEDNEKIRTLYANFFKTNLEKNYINFLTGNEAINYLFRVSCGLESLVVGEDQILGQIKDALIFSRSMGFVHKTLNRIFELALSCGKLARSTYKISEVPLSISYIGIKMLSELCDLKSQKVLIIGSGKMATLALKYMTDYNAKHIGITTRTKSHGYKLQKEYPYIEIIDFEDRYKQINNYDIVISATSAFHYVVYNDRLLEHLDKNKKLVFLDLGNPRDVEPIINKLDNVKLINIDMLSSVVDENQSLRKSKIKDIELLIEEKVKETEHYIEATVVDNTICSLYKRCDVIVNDSYEYLKNKLNLTSHEERLLKKVLKASLNRLIHDPVVEMKEIDSDDEREMCNEIISKLFKLEK